MAATRDIDRFRRATARRLRANATPGERRLWQALRQAPMLGSHFRRQVPIGPYVADFACLAARLIIEVDGSQHAERHTAVRDAERTRWLEQQGYRVMRLWNNEVFENLAGVMEAIHAAVHGSTVAESKVLLHKRRRPPQ